MRILKYVNPDMLTAIGDWADSAAMSRHVKDPNREGLWRKELRIPIALRNQVDAIVKPKCEKRVTLGNHDNWMELRIREKMPELDGLLTFDSLIGFSENGWEVTPYGEHTTVGKLHLSHEFGHCGLNAARDTLKAVGGNSVFGHSHGAAVVYGGDAVGNKHVSMNVGWLGDPEQARYMHKVKKNRNWIHGVGLVHFTSAGDAHCQFIPFVRGVAVVDRKEIRL
jgi:hypothetical protein